MLIRFLFCKIYDVLFWWGKKKRTATLALDTLALYRFLVVWEYGEIWDIALVFPQFAP